MFQRKNRQNAQKEKKRPDGGRTPRVVSSTHPRRARLGVHGKGFRAFMQQIAHTDFFGSIVHQRTIRVER